MEDLAAVVEMGESIDTVKYIDLGWQKRLNFVDQVLAFVERVQPLIFLDFRRQQVKFCDLNFLSQLL
jgi:hypothetical protein